ncbi:MAG TPA: YfhO family protein, partial [Thermoanaerobaculia bacterium]|nr:YfhO family protein [Thermoanaerobaculia bacterium]
GEVVSIRGQEDFVRLLTTRRFANDVAFANVAAFRPGRGIVRKVEESANRIRIEAESEGRGFLVLSVTPHKYWRVRVDGVEAKPIVTNLGYQGLELGPGRHVIEMRYRNPLIAIGVVISLVTMAALAVGTMRAP